MENTIILHDIQSLEDFHLKIRMNSPHTFFRGQANKVWPLNTTLQRYLDKYPLETLWSRFQSAFDEFCKYADSLKWDKNKPTSENKTFYYLSIARHLGLPCNLIDWTSSFDYALFLTCKDFLDKDGALFILTGYPDFNKTPFKESPLQIDRSKIICKDFDFLHDNRFDTMSLGRIRRFRQNGFFSIISKNDMQSVFEDLLPPNSFLLKLIIPANFKGEVMDHLQEKGTNSTIFSLEANDESEIIDRLIHQYFN